MTRGREQDFVSSRHQHLNRPLYWQLEHDRVLNELTRLEYECRNLKKENHGLRQLLRELGMHLNSADPANPKKRKIDDETGCDAATRSVTKKARSATTNPLITNSNGFPTPANLGAKAIDAHRDGALSLNTVAD